LVNEVVFVVEEQYPKDAPHVVGEIGVEELHAPPFAGRWETSEHQQ
jgi:hypothetical protein